MTTTIGHPTKITFFGGSVPPNGTAVSVEYTDGVILWDDDTNILWDDGTNIEWSHHTDISPDVYFNFSVPRITFAGEAE